MSFSLTCNNCGNSQLVKSKIDLNFDGIDIDVTEDCGFQGCVVETIDFQCWKCGNEINI